MSHIRRQSPVFSDIDDFYDEVVPTIDCADRVNDTPSMQYEYKSAATEHSKTTNNVLAPSFALPGLINTGEIDSTTCKAPQDAWPK